MSDEVAPLLGLLPAPEFCFHCQAYTPTVESDCVVCGLSKPTPAGFRHEIVVGGKCFTFEQDPTYGPFIYGPDGDGFQLTKENLTKFFTDNM